MIDREIKYNRETKDFDCYVDSRYIGSRANYRAGDELCDEVAFDLCEQGLIDEVPTNAEPATALMADCAAVIRAALGGPVANGGIVADLRRAEARLRSHGW